MPGMRKTVAMFGGAAALAVTLGFGSLAVDNATIAMAASSYGTPPSVNGTPALPSTGASGTPTGHGSNVHTGVLTGCIVTANGC
jgi:hypothetical protein